MGQADVNVNLWLKDTKRFADLFNAILFQGKAVILPGESSPQPGDNRSQSSGRSGEKYCKKAIPRYHHELAGSGCADAAGGGITDCHSLHCTVESNAL